MSLAVENFHDLVNAISDPACFIKDDLSVICCNETFFSLSGLDLNTPIKNFKLDECISLNHTWSDDEIFIYPFKKKNIGIRNSLIIKNSINSVINVSVRSVPFVEDSGEVKAALVVFKEKVEKIEASGEIIELIEQQEEKLEKLEGIDKEAAFTNSKLKNLIIKKNRQLIEANRTLQGLKEEINEELEMAKSVQDSLMPKNLPDFTNIDVSSIYMPAAMVGGDFYDIINTQTRKIAILIFDVSGHGVPAALIGATAKMLFAHYIETIESPAKIFHEVNSKLCSFLKTEHYLTAFLGIIDPIQSRMVYSRAGHVKPIVYNAAKKEVSALDVRGFFIGHSALADIAEYKEETVFFDPDDKVVFYTDGLTEGCNKNNELYGRERLTEKVKDCGHLPPSDLLNEVLEDQVRFREGIDLRDDFTMLCIQIRDSEYLMRESGFTKQDAPNTIIIYEPKEIEGVCSSILKAMDHCGFTDKEIKRARVCIVEMLINSMAHGNKNNPNRKVIILYKVEQEKVVLSIIDEGEGFDYNNLPNPLDPENLLKDSGRGIFIIKNYVNEVHFNKKGNRILVVKYHGGDDK